MTTSEQLLRELCDAHPMTRELKLADVAKIYGEGFAAQLRKQIRDEAEATVERQRHRRPARR